MCREKDVSFINCSLFVSFLRTNILWLLIFIFICGVSLAWSFTFCYFIVFTLGVLCTVNYKRVIFNTDAYLLVNMWAVEFR